MKKAKLMQDEVYERQAEICSALANPVRLKILDLLGEGEGTAKDLLEALNIPKTNLSQHLNVLKRSGLLHVRSEGLFQYLSLSIPEIKQACGLVRRVIASQADQQLELVKALRMR